MSERADMGMLFLSVLLAVLLVACGALVAVCWLRCSFLDDMYRDTQPPWRHPTCLKTSSKWEIPVRNE